MTAAATSPFEQAFQARDALAFRALLPQGRVVDSSDVLRFFDHFTNEKDFHGISWHATRLTGIGGSEAMSALQMGTPNADYDPFSNPVKTWEMKLCRMLPDEATGKMLRGNFLEEGIKGIFHHQFKATTLNDEMRATKDVKISNHPWLRVNPDDIVLIKGKAYMVDYKAPDEPSHSVLTRYAAQLHHGSIAAEAAKVKLHGMLLVQLDYLNGQVKPLLVERDEAMRTAILRGGDKLWNCVLDAQKPHVHYAEQAAREISVSAEQKYDIQEAQKTAFYFKQVANQADKKASMAENELKTFLADAGVSNTKEAQQAGLSLFSVSTKEKIKLDVLEGFLKSNAISPDVVQAPINKYDADEMAKRLRELGVDTSQFIKSEISIEKVKTLFDSMGVPHEVVIEKNDPGSLSLRLKTGKEDAELKSRLTEEATKAFSDIQTRAIQSTAHRMQS